MICLGRTPLFSVHSHKTSESTVFGVVLSSSTMMVIMHHFGQSCCSYHHVLAFSYKLAEQQKGRIEISGLQDHAGNIQGTGGMLGAHEWRYGSFPKWGDPNIEPTIL